MKHLFVSTLLAIAIAVPTVAEAGAFRLGFAASTLERNDDDSTGFENFGFIVDFFGTDYTGAYVNNNGNITFDEDMSSYTPFGLTGDVDQPIIAPFFGDVDTEDHGNEVQYGAGTVGGRDAWGVSWRLVDYYDSDSAHGDQLNSFQLVLVERFDTGLGNFDIEFNYDQILWETGDASDENSDNDDGLGGDTPAAVGYSNGAGSYFQLEGSLVAGTFLDSGTTPLIDTAFGISVDETNSLAGRIVFQAREGVVETVDIPEPGSLALLATGAAGAFALLRRRRRN